ncbi:MAG: hypothetical protein NTZ49_03310 [Candidatus Parcubacteria bacterium]|nr:hypothetical protein [Candidatus Parcubacteria bacterium]
MKITICSSIEFTPQIKEVLDQLSSLGHIVEIPKYSQKILNGDLTLEEFMTKKRKEGDLEFRNKAEEDLIKRYYRIIDESDAILVLNLEKNGIQNYIGGNTFLEMGFAFVLNKQIFLWNDIPKMQYSDELIAMKPTIINHDLGKIK